METAIRASCGRWKAGCASRRCRRQNSPSEETNPSRASNFRFLIGALEEAAYRDNLDLLHLLDFMNWKTPQR